MVMRNLAGNVVQDVRLANPVSGSSANPSHETSQVTEQATVQCSKCTTGEGEFRCTVVGEEGVGVLKECDQNKPMVNPIVYECQ